MKAFINRIKNFRLKQAFGKRSFSQCGEDQIVKHIFDQKQIYTPTFLDIGANHPFLFNNTALFHFQGSRGINVEPAVHEFNLLKQLRGQDINLNIGVDDKPGTLEYFEMENSRLNTFSKEEADKYITQEGMRVINTQKIEVWTVNQIIEKHFGSNYPDFLSIDTEGLDYRIVNSLDFAASKPKVICLETIPFTTKGKSPKDKELIDLVVSKGFAIHADTYINTIFVSNDYW